MLTPNKYWRAVLERQEASTTPPSAYTPPSCLTSQKKPPAVGDGLLLADYDEANRTGLIAHLGILTRVRDSSIVEVDWRPSMAEIGVDTDTGDRYWKSQPGFGFAKAKVADYGLHQLFADHFAGLEPRELPHDAVRPNRLERRNRSRGGIPQERLEPLEVVGTPTTATRGGFVYVLRSAYGFKAGRTRNLPNRMRAFGVKLPIAYTIPLCVWFDDCFAAESRYHRMFGNKHINGEWFNLDATDIETIHGRA